MVLIALIITLIYLILIGSFVFGFDKVKPFRLEDVPSQTKFSVVIAFRNEAENLPSLLHTINNLKYARQLFEVIFVDDASEDNSVEIIRNFKAENPTLDIKIIENERRTNSPKKDAITKVIKHAKNDWIITTDADCLLPEYWLESFDEYIQKSDAKCIVAPINYQVMLHFLDQFQLLDILSLQGATVGGFGIRKPFLCNGANFAYQRELFHELNGFKNNDTIASGDDIFLLEKAVNAHPNQVHYLKCEQAIVKTKPQPTWAALISQRKRWAAKTSAYNNWFGKLTGFIVLLMNAMIISSLTLGVFDLFDFRVLFYILVIKFSIDFLLIYKTASFLGQKGFLRNYGLGFLIYPFFSVYIVFVSAFKGYKWKDRTYNK